MSPDRSTVLESPEPPAADAPPAGSRVGWIFPVLDASLALARRRPVQRALGAAMVVFAAIALAVLVVANLDQLRAAPWRLDLPRLIVGLLFQASTCLVATLLWMDISAQLGAGWNPRRDARVYGYSLIARRLPGALWHVLGRAAFYGEVGLGKRVGLMGSAIEAGLLVVTGVAVWLASFAEIQPYGLPLGLLLIGLTPLVFRPAMRILLRGGGEWLPPRGRLYLWLATDVAAWLLGCTGVYFEYDALYPLGEGAWIHVVAATTASIVASAAVVFLPGGLGLRELGMTGLMSGLIPTGVAAALAIVFRVSILTIELIWAASLILFVPTAGGERGG
ncbi:MAG TPA: hypothetical protein VG370_14890 [Chloroflexota bacterium]|nr:hypothetical protein [Chloroflexota bacterium]